MFDGCMALKGNAGTVYDPNKEDKTYARPDGGEPSPGYFTAGEWQGLESVQKSEIRSQKVIKNGHLFIERNGKLYNAQGAEVK